MNYYRKTHHFLLRQWERCIDDIELNKILRQIPVVFKQKTHVFVSKTWLKNLKIKAMPNAALVIIVGKGNCLLTLFIADDFWTYIQRSGCSAGYYVQHDFKLGLRKIQQL